MLFKWFARVAMALSLTLLLNPGVAAAEEAAELGDARGMFLKGVELFEARRYEEALALFEGSYKLVPKPVVLFNIAMTEMSLGRRARAREHFEMYLEDVGDTGDERLLTMARENLSQLSAELARLQIEWDRAGDHVLLDDRGLGETPLSEPVWVEPGKHEVVIVSDNRAALERIVHLVPGQLHTLSSPVTQNDEQAVEVEVAPGDEPAELSVVHEEPPHRGEGKGATPWKIAAISSFGASAVSAIVGGVFIYQGVEAQRRGNRAVNDPEPTDRDKAAADVKMANIGMGVSFGIACAFAIGGAVLSLKGRRESRDGSEQAVAWSLGGDGLTVSF